jgi:RNA polymerase sigma-70 factor, ECF subfamily
METTVKTKIDKSLVMRNAWKLWKSGKFESFSIALKTSWAKAKSNEMPVIESLYQQHYAKILNFINFRVKNTVIAEELTNDVFMKAYDHLAIFDASISHITTWLYNIAKNKVIDYYRTEGQKSQRYLNTSDFVDSEGNEFFQISDNADTSSVAEGNEVSADINKALEGLKPNYKRVAELFFLEQKQYNEIAEILQMPMNTVKVTLMRAKEMLQKSLQGSYAAM